MFKWKITVPQRRHRATHTSLLLRKPWANQIYTKDSRRLYYLRTLIASLFITTSEWSVSGLLCSFWYSHTIWIKLIFLSAFINRQLYLVPLSCKNVKCKLQILSLCRLLLLWAKRQREKETERDTDRQSVAVERREKRGDRKAVRQI